MSHFLIYKQLRIRSWWREGSVWGLTAQHWHFNVYLVKCGFQPAKWISQQLRLSRVDRATLAAVLELKIYVQWQWALKSICRPLEGIVRIDSRDKRDGDDEGRQTVNELFFLSKDLYFPMYKIVNIFFLRRAYLLGEATREARRLHQKTSVGWRTKHAAWRKCSWPPAHPSETCGWRLEALRLTQMCR